MSASTETERALPLADPAGRKGTVHFFITAAILLAASGWWLFARQGLQWWLQKEAVPWPSGVQVREDFRLVSLPDRLGPYQLAQNGDRALSDDERGLLGIGTSWDESRHADRCSNWYSDRAYVDTRVKSPNERPVVWRLQITYYTGGLDTVPHIPNACLAQGGATLLGTTIVSFSPGATASPWEGPLAVNRTRYEFLPNRYSQYYFFSLNGRPESDWKRVRWELAKPWVRFCYFAKVQFSMEDPVEDAEKGDRQAEEFLQAVLPYVLQALPMPADIDNLGKQKR